MPRRIPQRSTSSAAALACALLVAASAAHALSTDRNQQMFVDADYSKIQQSTDDKPGVSFLNGNVQVVQGSMKAHGDEATIYQHASNAKDAQGNDISGGIQRVILIGKKAQAHMQQLQDNDAGLIIADADKIDYNSDTAIADLTGNVTVVQQGRGTFHGTHMTYNTNTGEMESGDNTPANRVHLVMEPKKQAATTPAAKPADAPAAAAPPTAKPAKKAKKPSTSATKPAASGTP
ncbi:MAG: lipopolysaccharide transport periplasmic protein LptA [Dokdonella sp.]